MKYYVKEEKEMSVDQEELVTITVYESAVKDYNYLVFIQK